jgi:Acyl-CoA dehydrogenase, C-terminal domain
VGSWTGTSGSRAGPTGPAFAIVFAISDPEAEPHRRGTMLLVPADAPGVEVVRPVPVLGHAGRGWNTHCEVRFTGVRVPVANTLGGEGKAFRLAQKRLGPGRINHVMRWLGQMQRAFELMCRYANEREAFGGPLAEKQTVKNWVADSAAEIQVCRLLTMDAARKIDQGSEARVKVSLLKVFAARVLCEVIDRAVQVHGARGLTDETPLARMALNARAARIYDGPDEVHRVTAARRILSSFRDGGGWAFSRLRLVGRLVGRLAQADHRCQTPNPVKSEVCRLCVNRSTRLESAGVASIVNECLGNRGNGSRERRTTCSRAGATARRSSSTRATSSSSSCSSVTPCEPTASSASAGRS